LPDGRRCHPRDGVPKHVQAAGRTSALTSRLFSPQADRAATSLTSSLEMLSRGSALRFDARRGDVRITAAAITASIFATAPVGLQGRRTSLAQTDTDAARSQRHANLSPSRSAHRRAHPPLGRLGLDPVGACPFLWAPMSESAEPASTMCAGGCSLRPRSVHRLRALSQI
jgi:hypothetical protein